VAGVIPKLDKLKVIKTKKIVIIGGSNASFGIDSELMEERLGIPVVNMSLHGGLPLKFIIEQVKNHLEQGDILILSKEYSGLKDQYWSKMSGTELPKILTYDLTQMRILLTDRQLFESSTSGIFNTIKYYINKYPIINKKEKNSVYSYQAFNKDNLKEKFIAGAYKNKVEKHSLPEINDHAVFLKGLSEYGDYFNKKGIKFYFTPPVIIEGYYEKDEIMPFWRNVSNNSGIPLLNESKAYTYETKYFFNSHYHTNVEGRRLRTESLIQDIRQKTGLAVKKTNKNIFVAREEVLNMADLSMFDKMLHFKIVYKTADELKIEQTGDLSKNYFRIQFKNEDLSGYNLYLKLKCESEVLENIRFKGIGKPMKFDSISTATNGEYEVWKKADDVYYNDGNSYIGITLLDNKNMLGKTITFLDVAIYENINIEDVIVEEYNVFNSAQKSNLFKIISQNKHVDLKDIVLNPEVVDDVELTTNTLYKILKLGTDIQIINFYSGKVVFKTENSLTFKSNEVDLIKIFD
jgi:hypothetical protein